MSNEWNTDSADEPPLGSDRLVSQFHYDPSETYDLTAAIVKAVAEAEGVEITSVSEPYLYDSVDTAALENILFDDSSGTDRANAGRGDRGNARFSYHGYAVTVDGDGWIQVYETQSD
ncbi:HalOD1 output domain-containing protein [Halegenticoccus tardaugens]|uniref:HalOD1 output domain-containing protein n=1 Tax=Halegenticoccus tardaugens TaxID=2071624 RepID=UPI0013E9583A|nr:HalOD1 output domain-containing protein [Halegenticoccus tardaugens]